MQDTCMQEKCRAEKQELLKQIQQLLVSEKSFSSEIRKVGRQVWYTRDGFYMLFYSYTNLH